MTVFWFIVKFKPRDNGQVRVPRNEFCLPFLSNCELHTGRKSFHFQEECTSFFVISSRRPNRFSQISNIAATLGEKLEHEVYRIESIMACGLHIVRNYSCQRFKVASH